jgi:hypothetical protein
MAAPNYNEALKVLFVSKTWQCLQAPVYKHAHFNQVLQDEATLSEFVNIVGLHFCDNLLKTIEGVYSPTVDFFKTLPSAGKKQWGVCSCPGEITK